MPFLPSDYKEPDTSNYMRFEQGENTFRVLSDAITGMEYWKTIKDDSGKDIRKPFRVKPGVEIKLSELEEDKNGDLEMPKHFWAFVVFNRNAEKIQILEITQKTIRRQITALYNMEKWGDPKKYDITVTREGEGFDTDYTVMPNPKEKLDKGVLDLYKSMNIDLNALYKGDDPFASNNEKQIVDPEDIPDDL